LEEDDDGIMGLPAPAEQKTGGQLMSVENQAEEQQ
jgi:hypothetical protein